MYIGIGLSLINQPRSKTYNRGKTYYNDSCCYYRTAIYPWRSYIETSRVIVRYFLDWLGRNALGITQVERVSDAAHGEEDRYCSYDSTTTRISRYMVSVPVLVSQPRQIPVFLAAG
jgi:hypothetical protein